jgi:hypothetical protein
VNERQVVETKQRRREYRQPAVSARGAYDAVQKQNARGTGYDAWQSPPDCIVAEQAH